MLGLKSRRKAKIAPYEPDGSGGDYTHTRPFTTTFNGMPPTPIVGEPVVDGQPVEPYELPQDPLGDHEFLEWLKGYVLAREKQEATRADRVLRAIVKQIRDAKGPGFEVTVLRRYTFEFHRLRLQDGNRKYRLELYRRERWDLNVELWARAKRRKV